MSKKTPTVKAARAKFNLFRTDLSPHITSYDLLKTFAIITMIIDHVGYFFFPQIEEFRVIGRLSMPVWFFLIGYADTRKLEWRLWIWGFILLIGMTYMKGGVNAAMPLNIIFTFLLTRAILDWVMVRATQKFDALFGVFWLCALTMYPSQIFLEYGSAGFLFAMMGYMAKRQDKLPNISFQQVILFSLLCVGGHIVNTWLWFKFETINIAFLCVLLPCMCLPLLYFESKTFPLKGTLANIIKYSLFITGRRTLEIYVLHLLIFMYIIRYGIL